MGEIIIRLAYGVMIVGAILCFIFSKNHQQDLRRAANDFALAFVKLSNFISPKPPKEGLRVRSLPDGGVQPLPLAEQPEALRRIVQRANEQDSVDLFAQADAAADKVSRRASANRTQRAQFQQPIDQLLLLAQTFLRGCEDLSTIDTEEKRAAFDSFLLEQPQHRMVLLKRITGDLADEYRSLNKKYAAEMEKIEADEAKARRQKGGGGQKAADAAQKPKPAKPAPQSKAAPDAPQTQAGSAAPAPDAAQGNTAPDAPASAPEPPKSSAEDWHGWGCG